MERQNVNFRSSPVQTRKSPRYVPHHHRDHSVLVVTLPQAEFSRFRQTLTVENCRIPTKAAVAAKVADINNLLSHQFTKEELDEKLRRQGTLDNRTRFFKRVELENNVKLARAIGDEAEVTRLEGQLAELTTPRLAFGTSLFKPQQVKETEQERLAEINLRNQRLNYENVRRAQIEEKKASRKATVASAHRAEKKVPTSNNRGLVSGNATPMTGTEGSNTPGPGTPSGEHRRQKSGISKIRHRNMDDENIAALDLDINIEI